jgi:hypothetical protein
METLRINRAPVITLWAVVVAERLGMSRDTALTAGQTLAGLTAHSKRVRLGICAAPEGRPQELYERFRAEALSGECGWGAKGILDLAKIRALGQRP